MKQYITIIVKTYYPYRMGKANMSHFFLNSKEYVHNINQNYRVDERLKYGSVWENYPPFNAEEFQFFFF